MNKLIGCIVVCAFLFFIDAMIKLIGPETRYGSNKSVIETIIYESAGEPIEGQIAVGRVIRNRSVERKLSFKNVVKQPYQFSCWNSDIKRTYTQKEYEIARLAWKISKYSTLDANMYHASYITPYWAKKKYRKRMRFIVEIGNHKFYKEKNNKKNLNKGVPMLKLLDDLKMLQEELIEMQEQNKSIPHLKGDNVRLFEENTDLKIENKQLRDTIAQMEAERYI